MHIESSQRVLDPIRTDVFFLFLYQIMFCLAVMCLLLNIGKLCLPLNTIYSIIYMCIYIYIYIYICDGLEISTQVLMLADQVLYLLSHNLRPSFAFLCPSYIYI